MEKRIKYAVGYPVNSAAANNVGMLYLKINKRTATEVGEEGQSLNAKLFDTPEEAFEWAKLLTRTAFPLFIVAVRVEYNMKAVL